MANDYQILEDIESLPKESLESYILERASIIVRNTQGDSWDDPEDWQIEAVELAHAAYRLLGVKK